jgi:DNA invertase Pin-like site-specific DNA recombinase
MDMPPLTNRADEPVRTEGTQIGYASYSTREGRACLEAQVAELRRSGCQSTKSEEVDSIGDCKVLARLVRRLKCWDVLTVTKLDRLARSAREAMEIAQTLSEKGAALRILNLNLYTATPAGKQLLQVLAAAAELERTVTLNRQHERKCREMRAISRDINTCELAQAYLAHGRRRRVGRRTDKARAEG